MCVYDSAALWISNPFFQTLHPGDIHGPSATSGPGCVPSLRVPRLAHDAPLRHPAQAVGTRRHCPRRRPASRALAAVRPSDLLHQQPVSHAGLLRNHRPAGGLCFHRICWIFISVLRICSTAFNFDLLEGVKLRARFLYKPSLLDQSEHGMSCCCSNILSSLILILFAVFSSASFFMALFFSPPSAEHQAQRRSSGSEGSDAVHGVWHSSL